ncbi:MAG: InlB B-repeat-containing protein, partial [Candidatus Bathyarchaeota archaeon]|nr:InlB B-repeat-containing protein [Candidatus Termiticorpusculum sp.]
TFTVTYDLNGGSGSFDDSNLYYAGDLVTVLSGVPTLAGYTFDGWLYDDAPRSGGYSFDMPAVDVELVAVWSANTYTVTYAPGAQGAFTSQPHTGLSYGVNTPAFSGGTPAGNSGYTFNGWSPALATTVTANVTYTAQWTYTGSSGGDGGSSSGSGSGSSKPKPSPAPTVPAVPDDKPPVEPTPPGVPPEEPELTWALLNLVLGVIGVVLAVVLVVLVLLWRNKDQKKVEDQKQLRTLLFLTTIILGIVGIVVFFLTEDMSRTMGWVDMWSIVSVVVFAVEVIALTLFLKLNKINIFTKNNA